MVRGGTTRASGAGSVSRAIPEEEEARRALVRELLEDGVVLRLSLRETEDGRRRAELSGEVCSRARPDESGATGGWRRAALLEVDACGSDAEEAQAPKALREFLC